VFAADPLRNLSGRVLYDRQLRPPGRSDETAHTRLGGPPLPVSNSRARQPPSGGWPSARATIELLVLENDRWCRPGRKNCEPKSWIAAVNVTVSPSAQPKRIRGCKGFRLPPQGRLRESVPTEVHDSYGHPTCLRIALDRLETCPLGGDSGPGCGLHREVIEGWPRLAQAAAWLLGCRSRSGRGTGVESSVPTRPRRDAAPRPRSREEICSSRSRPRVDERG